MTDHLGAPDDPPIQNSAPEELTPKSIFGFALFTALACFLSVLAFANGALFPGAILLVLVIPLTAFLIAVMLGQSRVPRTTATLFAILIVSSIAIVTVEHFRQEGRIEQRYAAHCEAYRNDNMSENYDGFDGWAARDRTFDEIVDWTVDNCGGELSETESQSADDDRSDWSDCDKRIWVVTRYEGYSDQEERDFVEQIWADCDPAPGTAKW